MNDPKTDSTRAPIDVIRGAQRCQPDIAAIGDALATVTPENIEQLIRSLIDAGDEKALGLLLLACGMRGLVLDPDLVCETIDIVEEFTDMAGCIAAQGPDAVAPLLRAAEAEALSWERQAYAARLAAELTVREDGDRDEVLRVLRRLETRIRSREAQLILVDTLVFLNADESNRDDASLFPPLLKVKHWEQLPKQRPHAVIGDGRTLRRPIPKLGRNEPCHCGSGKKYKHCCHEKDRELLRDASPYEGLTQSEIVAKPGLVDDHDVIDRMRAHQVAHLDPKDLNARQLLAASRRAQTFGRRGVAYKMLLEADRRDHELPFDRGHFEDLMDFCLAAGDLELARQIRDHLGDFDYSSPETVRFQFDLLEQPDRFKPIAEFCRQSLTAAADGVPLPDDPLIMMAHATARRSPALAIVIARAAILQFPDRDFDNEILLEVIREARADMEVDPWTDPAEELVASQWSEEEKMVRPEEDDQEVIRLRNEVAEARDEIRERQERLHEMEERIADLARELDAASGPAASSRDDVAPSTPERATETDQTVERLRRQVENMKVEIAEQQERRQALRNQLSRQQKRVEKLESTQVPPAEPLEEDEGLPVPEGPHRLVLPVFEELFQEKCRQLPPLMCAKALRAVTGFTLRDPDVWRHTKPLAVRSHTYRIRIGIHHRLLIEWIHGKSLRVLDLIPRAELETWLRRH